MYANYHVTDYLDYKNLTGFVKTIECDDHYVPSRKDVFALDCEMCYTIIGLELTRITVVDINRKTVYDALVKPSNRIVDYNTTYVTFRMQYPTNNIQNKYQIKLSHSIRVSQVFWHHRKNT